MFLALFVKILYFCLLDLEIDFLTFKMTFSYENNTRHVLPQSKSHGNEVLHMFLVVFVKKLYFSLLDLEMNFLTLKMTAKRTP